jgi:3'(2'), 5'-bisphosphate nucleotidase
MPTIDLRLLDDLTKVACRGAAAILAIPPTSLNIRQKRDRSPVTQADDAAEEVILESLTRLLPGVPIVSEEAAERSGYPAITGDFLLVDPLDGTREFLEGKGEYTVNIALVSAKTPVLGIVVAPALGLAWRGLVPKSADRLRWSLDPEPKLQRPAPIHTRRLSETSFTVAVSRSHLDAATARYVSHLPVASRIVCGSSLKFCRVAEGAADLYPRLSSTSAWDIAAGHAVIAAAGGVVTSPEHEPIAYGLETAFQIPGFLAWGDPHATDRYSPQASRS